MIRPRILYLCGQAPWRRNGGSMLRNYWMIRALSRRYRVDLVVAGETSPMPPGFAAMIDDYACFPRDDSSRSGVGRILRTAAPGESTLTAGWTNDAMREYVAERVGRHAYAAIQVDLPMVGALPRRDAIPIVYNAHNCESALLQRRAATEPLHVATLLTLDALRVRRQERALIERATLVVACSEGDVADFERIVPGVRAKIAIVPNGVDTEQFDGVRRERPEAHSVLISGSMDWRPNVLGLRWFLRHGLAPLRARLPDTIVRVAGRMEPALVAELGRYPNIVAVPNPVSMEPLLAAATVVAAPIVASSGTRLRILEAWAAGRPVVTTEAGAFGLDCRPGRELAICDQPEAFGLMLAELLESPAQRATLVANATERLREFDWAGIAATLLLAYDRLVVDEPERDDEAISERRFALSATS